MEPYLAALLGLSVVATPVLVLAHRSRAREKHRQELRARDFPAEWRETLKKNVGLYPRLPQTLKAELEGHVQVFLEEKEFEGCGGLSVTDEMRVTVAGLACLLLLNRRSNYYPKLTTVLLYPAAYVVEEAAADGPVKGRQVRLGESWDSGTVVLSWSDVTRSSHDIRDGHNLALHEFAHQLDQEDGSSDGVPLLEQKTQYYSWAEVLSEEYRQLQKLSAKGKKHVMDSYGATNPAEFFAVATETFFEKPRQLKRKHPELYEELKTFYHLDPIAWKKQ